MTRLEFLQSEEEKSDEESVPVQKTEPSKFQKKKEKKKKGGKEKTTEEEDVDALLAEIEKPKEKTGQVMQHICFLLSYFCLQCLPN